MNGDEVLCPFCGRNVWWSSEDRPCQHLIADWSLDPEDNGGGIFGEMLSRGFEGIAEAEALARVAGRLCAWVWGAGEAAVATRLVLAANAVADEKPAWWDALDEAIRDCYDPESILDGYGRSGSGEPECVPLANDFADPVTRAIVQSLPSVRVTYEILGGMTSGESIFAWSDDPVAGRAAIDAAIASAVRTVEMVLATLEGSGS